MLKALHNGKRVCAKLGAHDQKRDKLGKAIQVLSEFLDMLVERVAAFEQMALRTEEKDQQEAFEEAVFFKTQALEALPMFDKFVQGVGSDESE